MSPRKAFVRPAEPAILCRSMVPYLMQATRQGLQDMGVRSVSAAWEALHAGQLTLETRSGAAQAEGGVHHMHSFSKKQW